MKSEQIEKLAVALNKVQKELKKAIKGHENPYFKSKYSDLGEVWEACRESLSDHGFSVVQAGGVTPTGQPTIVTTLLHSSGQWISGEYLLMPVKNDPQALGSSWSYARRYSLAAIVGIVSDIDDDCESAMNRNGQSESKPAPAPTRTYEKVNQAGLVKKTTFTPSDVRRKDGTSKAGKPYTLFTIISPDGKEITTFDTKLGELAEQAIGNHDIEISYQESNGGKYLNAVDVKVAQDVEF